MFNASQFTATQHSTAEDKAKFANQFVKFVQSDFRSKEFPIWFYQRLSMTFGHIAHYDRGGFFHTFFDDQEGKLEFIDTTHNHSDIFNVFLPFDAATIFMILPP